MLVSILEGMSQAALQASLASLQTAYLALAGGQSSASVTLTSGEVTRSVTYRSTDLGGLAGTIGMVQRQLGVPGARRRAIGVRG